MKRRVLIGSLFCLLATGLQAQKASRVIPNVGEVHIPVIVLEFSDVHFTLEEPLQHFQNLLNQPGYSVNGATGSVRDYFTDNSHNLFTPVFDVYGPVTLDKKMAYYGKDIIKNGQRIDDTAPEQALLDGCRLLDEKVKRTFLSSTGLSRRSIFSSLRSRLSAARMLFSRLNMR